jgi:hypothetical protein
MFAKREGAFLHGHCLYVISPRARQIFHRTPDWLHGPSGNDEEGESDGEREWYSIKILYPSLSPRQIGQVRGESHLICNAIGVSESFFLLCGGRAGCSSGP